MSLETSLFCSFLTSSSFPFNLLFSSLSKVTSSSISSTAFWTSNADVSLKVSSSLAFVSYFVFQLTTSDSRFLILSSERSDVDSSTLLLRLLLTLIRLSFLSLNSFNLFDIGVTKFFNRSRLADVTSFLFFSSSKVSWNFTASAPCFSFNVYNSSFSFSLDASSWQI